MGRHWINLNRLKDQIYIKNDRFKSIIIDNRSILNQNRDRHFGFQRFILNRRYSTIEIDDPNRISLPLMSYRGFHGSPQQRVPNSIVGPNFFCFQN